jgi:raffinose/stachyose/melibiose transport system substrate-binding protein
MFKMKRLAMLFLMAMVVFSMAACGSAAETVTLRFLHKWPEDTYLPYWKDVVARFEAENPDIKISMEAVADEPMKEKLRVMMGGSNTPDIFFTWSGEFLNKFVKAGVALDLTPYLEKDTQWRDSFVKSLFVAGEKNGKQYGIPVRVSAKFFVYNKQKFAAAGIGVPKTWAEFLENCEKLKQKGEIPILLGNNEPWASCHYITTFNALLVPEATWRKDYNPATGEFSDPGYVEALELLKALNDKGYFNSGINSTKHQQTREMFYAGGGAIIYDEMPNFRRRYEAEIPGKWSFFICPPIEGAKGNPNLVTGDPDLFAVSASTQYPEQAIRFLKFVFNKENSELFCKELGFQSCVKGAVNESNSLKEVIEAMSIIEKADALTGWLDTEMEAAVVDKYLGNLQQLFDGKSPEAIMEEVRSEAEFVASEQ